MKKSRMSSLVLVLVFVGVFVGAEAKNDITYHKITTEISGVLLFSNQARIERRGVLSLKKGENYFLIQGLSAKLLADSVGLKLTDPRARLGHIRVSTRHQKVYHTQKARQSEKRLQRAEKTLRILSDRYHALKKQKEFLSNIDIASLPSPETVSDLEKSYGIELGQWRRTLAYQQKALADTQNKIQALLPRIDVAREKLFIALTVARKFDNIITRRSKDLAFVVYSSRQMRVPFTVTYRLPGAHWYPFYRARLLSRDKGRQATLMLQSFAMVKNTTGEKWINVRLHFSAADPKESAGLPVLKSRIIKSVSPRQTGRVKGNSQKKTAVPSLPKSSRIMKKPPNQKQRKQEQKIRPQKNIGTSKKYSTNQGLRQRSQSAQDFFSGNMSRIRHKRSLARSQKMQKKLGAYNQSKVAQERYFRRGRYRQALRHSNKVIASIRRLPENYQDFFAKEITRAKNLRRQALMMIDSQRFIRRLVSPQKSSRGYDYRYKAILADTIPSDGTFYKIPLGKTKYQANLFYEVVPVVKKTVFLMGRIRYAGGKPLLRGPMAVFHNQDYVGDSVLPNVAAGEHFSVSLGNDPSVRIERSFSQFRSTEGVFSKSYSYKKKILINVRNQKNFPILVKVYERLPKSRNDKVTVDSISVEPKPAWQNPLGVYRFELKIAPSSTKSIRLDYRLFYEADIRPVYRQGDKSF